MSCNATTCRRRRSANARPHGRPSFEPTWRCGGDRLLHRRGSDAARASHLLRAVFHPPREPPGVRRRDHLFIPNEAWMKQIARNATMEGRTSLNPARSGHEIHPVVPRHHCVRSGRTARAAGTQPEPECLCGTLGQVGQGGVLVQSDPIRRALVAAGAERLCRAFPYRAESPGEGQHPAVSSGCGPPPRGVSEVQRERMGGLDLLALDARLPSSTIRLCWQPSLSSLPLWPPEPQSFRLPQGWEHSALK
jgi:hypothetical protein